jgi:hypothetical protein
MSVLASGVTVPADLHENLYVTCVTVIIAMVVVVDVDQRGGIKEMPLRWRAFTAISLGGIFAVGILASPGSKDSPYCCKPAAATASGTQPRGMPPGVHDRHAGTAG